MSRQTHFSSHHTCRVLHFCSMAKLTISEAARVAGVARSTLQRAIRSGRVSADPDHRIDTAELLRSGFTLHEAPQQQSGAVRQVAAVRSTGAPEVQQNPPAALQEQELALLRQERDALLRERDLLQRTLDAAMEREHAAREREALVLQMLHAAQQQSQRLLDMPRGSATGQRVRWSAPAAPDTRSRILAYMQEHPGPQRPGEIAEALGLRGTPRYVMNRMVEREVLTRVAPGVYVLPEK